MTPSNDELVDFAEAVRIETERDFTRTEPRMGDWQNTAGDASVIWMLAFIGILYGLFAGVSGTLFFRG